MSLSAFQSGLLRLIADPQFRDAVTANGAAALGGDLTPLESMRLQRIAVDRGVDINRTLHKGFRLGKLRALLPLTCQLLGARRLARVLPAFWRQRPASSFSFLPEALDFCTWLAHRALRVRYLDEVLAYERAVLELERARTGTTPEQHVRFRHDPASLLATLAAGRRPRGIAARSCLAVGQRDARGDVQWQIRDQAPTGFCPPGSGSCHDPRDRSRRLISDASATRPDGVRKPRPGGRTTPATCVVRYESHSGSRAY